MAAILRDSTIVVRTRPQAIPLAMLATRISIHGFPLVPYMGMGSAWWPFGLLELRYNLIESGTGTCFLN